ncbi:D-alanyl-D-alanine carboxypeptidase / D-alanyl-D-alanine-endopeptidase (penicillin-binding protein 4) [Bryocella elongata]|uniref:D-alanyl-D-alanine carboxypeptidase / D-alanyl-D-alanine-endopeptidase (Penicillin-binding protein 4) n=1 Tax=Bryocella elongata TaxID=863522 RepID=A0A1H6BLK5_9BACT|nr:D-alanyl-D-alanine carboxypeptidase/D-alanyl-D-alanine-endopeptidase [Bryocella elongata]SEG61522.1 D-alanyl-D-alanine carboxypeptidase / D-alanyl-D-alanine-endopeptidase (penicillin-binding protein 4) [Bryocella elongata]
MGTQVASLVAQPEVSRAHWGVAVMALDGTPLYGYEEGQYFRPASNAKLFTSVAATQMLGLDKRFTTTVVGRGDIANGVLQGDLILKGGGDANFASGYVLPYTPKAQRSADAKPAGLADFDDLAAQIAAKGIREVDGDVVGDDTRFEYAPYPAGWSEEDMMWGYGAPVSALTVHDSQLDLTITPAPAGTKASPTIVFDPAVPFYTVNATPMDGHVWSVGTQDLKRNQVLEDREPYARDFHFFGYVDARHGAYTDELAVDRPAEFAAAALKQALEQHGITVKGSIRAQHYHSQFLGSDFEASHALPAAAQVPGLNPFAEAADSHCDAQSAAAVGQPSDQEHLLAEKQSVPFAVDLKLTMKESQNLHAELMLRNMGVNRDCMTGLYLHTALAWERAFLTREVGLDGDDFQLFDGSGLSTKDLVTPRATAQLLLYASKQPWFATWKDALPVAGVDGTLRARFPDAPYKGHIFAKTGTLGESRALSGYLETASGRTVIFSVMVDTHAPSDGGSDTKVMDAIVKAIAGAF